jgi:hypothetical protein
MNVEIFVSSRRMYQKVTMEEAWTGFFKAKEEIPFGSELIETSPIWKSQYRRVRI